MADNVIWPLWSFEERTEILPSGDVLHIPVVRDLNPFDVATTYVVSEFLKRRKKLLIIFTKE